MPISLFNLATVNPRINLYINIQLIVFIIILVFTYLSFGGMPSQFLDTLSLGILGTILSKSKSLNEDLWFPFLMIAISLSLYWISEFDNLAFATLALIILLRSSIPIIIRFLNGMILVIGLVIGQFQRKSLDIWELTDLFSDLNFLDWFGFALMMIVVFQYIIRISFSINLWNCFSLILILLAFYIIHSIDQPIFSVFLFFSSLPLVRDFGKFEYREENGIG
ncbi:hypothetical protein [Leptospira sp. GIMC2001]|uniref:hypothetical protein n=1 Tax=Leptospira sp. GIMC2001 TaxID=1513297 RepID=UPI00234A39E6|nr:hypothetical protein [Leptospira sp. GIMC2001]WCL48024.1 hypothetical protein O4O04_11920 [Leptospira sp. GIMC2001]